MGSTDSATADRQTVANEATVTEISPTRPIQSTHLEYAGFDEPAHQPSDWTVPVADLLSGQDRSVTYPSPATAIRHTYLDRERRAWLADLVEALGSVDASTLPMSVRVAHERVIRSLGLGGVSEATAATPDWQVA